MSGVVIAVNVGPARTVRWRGQTITTGIFKSPVAGRVRIQGVNLVGDQQADRTNHGGAVRSVYAYTVEDYAWWSSELGRDLTPGTFGENLTVRGIDANDALVGERWRIGTAVLQVTVPRVPCYKLAMRMDDPTFVKRFAAALRPGPYFTVLTEGEVGAGDAIEVVWRPRHLLSVREMARIYLFERHRLAAFLDVPELPLSWRTWAAEVVPGQQR